MKSADLYSLHRFMGLLILNYCVQKYPHLFAWFYLSILKYHYFIMHNYDFVLEPHVEYTSKYLQIDECNDYNRKAQTMVLCFSSSHTKVAYKNKSKGGKEDIQTMCFPLPPSSSPPWRIFSKNSNHFPPVLLSWHRHDFYFIRLYAVACLFQNWFNSLIYRQFLNFNC